MFLRAVMRGVTGVLFTAFAVVGCSASAPDLVHSLGGTPPRNERVINLSMKLARDQPTAFQVPVYLCSDRNVQIDRLTLVDASGIRIMRWGVQNVGDSNRGDATTLAQLGDYSGRRANVRCGQQHSARLGVEVERRSRETAYALAYRLHYRSDGEQKTTTLWTGVALCGDDGGYDDSAVYDSDSASTNDEARHLCATDH